MSRTRGVPELCAGDRLTRDEFHRRYDAMPDLKKAELVEGVVYMGSPVNSTHHGEPHAVLVTWLGCYAARTPGLLVSDNATVLLDQDNEVQPDAQLRIPERFGGCSRIGEHGHVEGPPELVIEVAASSASYDLHDKKNAYRRNGVPEYLVLRTRDAAVDWFVLRGGAYDRLDADAEGALRSERFPGLWLDVPALLRMDAAAVLRRLDSGLATAAHEAFAQRFVG